MNDTEKPDPQVPEKAAPGPAPGQQPKLGPPPSLDREQRSGPSLRELDAEIERELAEAMGELSDKEMYGDPNADKGKPPAAPQPGPKKGKILAHRGADVFVDVPGGRSQGVLPSLQFPEGVPPPGTEVDIQIEGYDHGNGLLILTRKGAAVHADWSSVAVGMTVEVRVTATNKGGLEVDVNGIRGFMPISQIDLYRVENAEKFVNERLLSMVVDVNPQERNLVVSRRALLEKEREETREKLWQELAEGQIREGVVRSVRDFGAFVDLGGVDGLVHVSEMSWTRVKNAGDILEPGQTVKVVVLRVDRETRKVGLGLKQLTPSPWDSIESKYPVGTVSMGKITRLMDFGAFVELEPGIEGLVHISEVAPQRLRRVADAVQVGQEVAVQVLRIDSAERRISLSIKAAQSKKVEEAEEEEAEGEEAEIRPSRPRTTPLRGGLGSE